MTCVAVAVVAGAAVPAAAGASTGGASADPAPAVERIACRARCEGAYVRAGSGLVVTGSALRGVTTVTFLGSKAVGDEATAVARKATPSRVLVTVPAGAVRGPVTVAAAGGRVSAPSKAVVRVLRAVTPKSGGGPIATAVSGRKAFIDGVRPPTLTYQLATDGAAAVTVGVVRAGDGATVATFDEGTVAPGTPHTVAWNGRTEGRYAFVVTAAGGGTIASTAAAGQVSADGFTLLGHEFPVRGKHAFGDAVAAFGGARGHQGQDVFAACGTPLVAARGGTVKMKRFQSRAGNYLVIDGAGEGTDMAYMHLREPAIVDQGDRVHTGQLLGYVGQTGDATACHLHFEEWSAPGWYTGGSPFDPLPDLKAWDAVS